MGREGWGRRPKGSIAEVVFHKNTYPAACAVQAYVKWMEELILEGGWHSVGGGG